MIGAEFFVAFWLSMAKSRDKLWRGRIKAVTTEIAPDTKLN